MQHYNNIAFAAAVDGSSVVTGGVTFLAGATITVRNSAGSVATIYSDNGSALKANPFTTAADGEYDFYAANGVYSIEIAATGYVTDTRSGIVLFDPSDNKIDITWHGAVRDGIANDTGAINAAIAASSAGQTLYFPVGDYLVGSASSSTPLSAIPVGVNIFMEKGAWLKGNGTWLTNFLFPSGNNILKVNIDGDSLPVGGVQDTWSESAGSAVAISASSATGLADNVENVVVCNSEIKNLQYGIITDGAKGWRVYSNNFHELRNCAVLIGAQDTKESYRCFFYVNEFSNLGDYAVAFYSTSQSTPGHNAHHSVTGNIAKNCQQITNGYAYGVEAGDPDYQHHITFSGNSYECDVVGLAGGNGGITISTTSDCVVTNNTLKGNLADVSNAVGINAVGFGGEVARRGLISDNHVEGFSSSAISLHGHSGCQVTANHIFDCGYTSSGFAPIRAGAIAASDVAIVGNFITINAGYAHYGAGTPAIGVSGSGLSRYTIKDNVITNPNDVGILVVGDTASHATGFTISGNQINGTQDATFFQREAIFVTYADDVTITDNVTLDAERGIVASLCTGGTIARNEFKGSATITTLYDITDSTGLKINDDIVTAPVTTAITPTARLAAAYTNYAKRCTSIVTENQGTTGAIASGATVTHGMFAAPTQVALTPISAAVACAVTAKGATNFTVTFAGGGTQEFDWMAQIR